MPRYRPRSAYRTRPSSQEHPDAADLALTALDRAVVRVEIREPTRLPPPARRPAPDPVALPRSPLAYAPWVLGCAVAFGSVAGCVAALVS